VFISDIYPESGIFVALVNNSPANIMATHAGSNWRNLYTVSHIQQWSDAAFLEWSIACRGVGVAVDGLKYVLRAQIQNIVTQQIVFAVLESIWTDSLHTGTPTIGLWGAGLTDGGIWSNGITIDYADYPNEFNAILGSPNGNGVAYLLATHKTDLQIKKTAKVAVFMGDEPYDVAGGPGGPGSALDQASLNLLFYVTDV
jgi:hypothetical protein